MQTLWDLGKLELRTREGDLQFETKDDCDQDREASSFSKVQTAEVRASAHVLQ